jgi:D-alanyl-D-alanine carboxypeptidase
VVRHFILAGLLAIAAGPVRAQSSNELPSFAQATSDRLNNVFDQSLSKYNLPGASVVIVIGNRRWSRTGGFANLETHEPLTPDHAVPVRSTSKLITTFAFLRLAEQGKVSLSDPLGRWLPGIGTKAAYLQTLPLRAVIDGSGGIPSYTTTEYRDAVRSDFARRLAGETTPPWTTDRTLTFTRWNERYTGTACFERLQWCYTNSAMVLIGDVVAKAGNGSLAAVLRREVSDPVGMRHTYLLARETPRGPTARLYQRLQVKGDEDKAGPKDDLTDLYPGAHGGNGDIASTAPDLMRLALAVFRGNFLSPASRSALQQMHPIPTGAYGLNLEALKRPYGLMLGKGGSDVTSNAYLQYYPLRDTFVTAVVNGDVSLGQPQLPLSGVELLIEDLLAALDEDSAGKAREP